MKEVHKYTLYQPVRIDKTFKYEIVANTKDEADAIIKDIINNGDYGNDEYFVESDFDYATEEPTCGNMTVYDVKGRTILEKQVTPEGDIIDTNI